MPGWTVTKDQDGLLALDRKGASPAADFRDTRANGFLGDDYFGDFDAHA